jgi:aspartate racemase
MKRKRQVSGKWVCSGRVLRCRRNAIQTHSRADITIISPDEDEQDYIHEGYMTERVHEVFKPETREGMIAIARRMNERDGIEGLILGGTELPLPMRGGTIADLPFLDTTAIHVDRALAACFQ